MEEIFFTIWHLKYFVATVCGFSLLYTIFSKRLLCNSWSGSHTNFLRYAIYKKKGRWLLVWGNSYTSFFFFCKTVSLPDHRSWWSDCLASRNLTLLTWLYVLGTTIYGSNRAPWFQTMKWSIPQWILYFFRNSMVSTKIYTIISKDIWPYERKIRLRMFHLEWSSIFLVHLMNFVFICEMFWIFWYEIVSNSCHT